jgi:hypothetical protein
MQASADVAASAAAFATDVAGACASLADDLGGDLDAVTDTDPAKRAKALCALAAERIRASAPAGATLAIDYQPPVCTVDAGAQGRCEATCSGDPKCDLGPAAVASRCDPRHQSGLCPGECTGRCDGSANAPVDCAGT